MPAAIHALDRAEREVREAMERVPEACVESLARLCLEIAQVRAGVRQVHEQIGSDHDNAD